MAISWGAWEDSGGNGMRVGLDVSWEAISHSETAATCTIEIWTENRYAYSDSQVLNYGGSISGSTSFSNTSGGGAVKRATKTYTYDYASTSYGTSPGTRTFSASLSGAYNGVTPSKSVTTTIPPRPIAAPAAPTNVAVSRVSDTTTKLTWTNKSTSGEPWTNVDVDWDPANDGTWLNKATLGNVSSYSDSGTAANSEYRYRVRATNSAGVSAFVNTDVIYTTPNPPTTAVRTPSGSDQVITWANKGGYTEYQTEVWRSVNDVWSLLATKSTGVTSHTDVAPSTADRIKYKVRHRTYTGAQPTLYSTYSNETTETAGVTIPPLAPTNLLPSGGQNVDPTNAITFTWHHNDGGDSAAQTQYEFQYRINGGAWVNSGAITSSTSSHTLAANTFATGQTVEWQVRTKGADASFSPWSSIASFNAVVRRKIAPEIDLNTGHLEVDVSSFDWTAPTLAQSWVNFGSGFTTAGRCKRGGIVYLKGVMKSGTISTTAVVFNLPVGWRPKERKVFMVISNGTVGRLDILANGDVIFYAGNSTYYSIDGISFPAEQ